MATMSRIFTAIILFIEFQSISSLTGYEIAAQVEEQQTSGQQPQVYQTPNGPTFTFYGHPSFNPNFPSGQQSTFQRPPGGNLIIHNPYISNPNRDASYIPGAPQPDIPLSQGPPVFTFNPNAQKPYQPPPGFQGIPVPPPPGFQGIPVPPPGSHQFNPNQMRPNPSDPQMPKMPQIPGSPQNPPPPKAPKGPVSRPQPDNPEAPGIIPQGQTQDTSGPIINSAASSPGQEVFVRHGQVSKDEYLFSTQAQVLIGTLAAFFSLCALIRCYSKCCWDRPKKRQTMDHDEYQRGAAVTRQNTNHIEADIDWSDNTENEDDDPLDDYNDDNAMTDIQQMRSRKARELVPDESIDSGIYSNADDRLDIDRADVEILMEEQQQNDDNNNKEQQYPLTDDETRAIMNEFKDTDDEYVD